MRPGVRRRLGRRRPAEERIGGLDAAQEVHGLGHDGIVPHRALLRSRRPEFHPRDFLPEQAVDGVVDVVEHRAGHAEALLAHGGHHFGMDARARVGARRYSARLRRVRQLIEVGGGHLRPSRVVHTGKQYGRHRDIHRKNRVAASAPHTCAAMNPGASLGRMPAKVSVMLRAMVTAGLAKDVDAVNQ